MATPTNAMNDKSTRRAARLAAHGRVEALKSANPKFKGNLDTVPDMAKLLDPNFTGDEFVTLVEALQIRGFTYTPNEFQRLVEAFRQEQPRKVSDAPTVQLQNFLDFLMRKELGNYLENLSSGKARQETKTRGYSHLYEQMLNYLNEGGDPQSDLWKTLEPDLDKHHTIDEIQKLSVRVNFYLEQQEKHPDEKVPDQFVKTVQIKYPHWDGKTPLPEVQLKRESATRAEIRGDKLGVSLEQLMEIMNQKTGKISMPGASCDQSENPFRSILFESGGKLYTIGAAYDEDGTFKVHAYECNKAGIRLSDEIADPEGWMTIKVTSPEDPPGMDVTEAVADACTKLRTFKQPAPELNEAEEAAAVQVSGSIKPRGTQDKIKVLSEAESMSAETNPEAVSPTEINEAPTITAATITASREAPATAEPATAEPATFRLNPKKAPGTQDLPLDFGPDEPDTAEKGTLIPAAKKFVEAAEKIPMTAAKSSESEVTEAQIKDALVNLLRQPVDEIQRLFNTDAGVLPLSFTPLIMNYLERAGQEAGKLEASSGYPAISLINKIYAAGPEHRYANVTGGQPDVLVKEVLNNLGRTYLKQQEKVDAVAAPVVEAATTVVAPVVEATEVVTETPPEISPEGLPPLSDDDTTNFVQPEMPPPPATAPDTELKPAASLLDEIKAGGHLKKVSEGVSSKKSPLDSKNVAANDLQNALKATLANRRKGIHGSDEDEEDEEEMEDIESLDTTPIQPPKKSSATEKITAEVTDKQANTAGLMALMAKAIDKRKTDTSNAEEEKNKGPSPKQE